MSRSATSWKKLASQFRNLQGRLQEAEDTLDAIRSGSIDALVVRTPRGEQLFTLKGADQTYRALVEAMTEGAVALRRNIVSYSNQAFAEMLKMPLERVMGASILELVQGEGFPRLLRNLSQGTVRSGTIEARLRTADGSTVLVMLSAGRFRSEGAISVCLLATDITKRKEAEEALRASEERFQVVARMATDAIWEWNLATGEFWRSEALADIFGYRTSEVQPDLKWWHERIHPGDRKMVLAAVDRAIKSPGGIYTAAYRFRRGNGTYAYVSDRGCLLRGTDGRMSRMVGAIADVTEQREAELGRRQLSRSILNAQEQERQRVARELHDSVNQLLSSAKYRLSSVIAANRASESSGLRQVHQLVEKAIDEIRVISRNLRPSELDDLGLIAALRALVHDFRRRTGIVSRFRGQPGSAVIPRELEMTLYRVAQEALTNVEKHSSASRVEVRLATGAERVALVVRDNGRGFGAGTNGAEANGGWGLKNMKERASLLGGSFSVKSAPKRGAVVAVEIPLNGASASTSKSR